MEKYLKELLDQGYNLIVVKRSKQDRCYCSQAEVVEESGTLEGYDVIEFPDGLIWPFIFNVIYNIKDLI